VKKLVAIAVVGALVWWFACRGRSAPVVHGEERRSAAPAAPARSVKPQTSSADRLSFAWQDINTRKTLGREGDTFTVDPSVKPTTLHLAVDIDRDRLAAVIDSFGYTESMMRYSYRSEQEREEKQAELARELESRGFALEGEDGIRVDYSWVVDHSREDMRPVAEGLLTAARQAAYESSRAFTGGVTSFVQSLQYRQPPELRTNTRGERIHTGGVTMPLETLANRAGDCDTKSLLLASILANIRGAGILFLEGSDHVFVGLRMPPRQGDSYVRVQGLEYVLVEVTTPWPLGSVSQDVAEGMARNEFKVIPLE
jgi:hypothetical protein